MGFLDAFKKKSASVSVQRPGGDSTHEKKVEARDSEPAPLPSRPIDAELLKRLGNIAAANTLVRGGQDPERLLLALNLDRDGKIDGDRPTMRFRFDVQRTGPDQWRLTAGIDDAVAYCRFSMGLDLPEIPAMDPATFDMSKCLGFPLTFSMPADHERSPLARSAFLLAWRVEGGMDSPSLESSLTVDGSVMGVELTRLDYAYVPTVQPNQHWVLLKCLRGEQSFWLGLDLSVGAGEVFPRRGEVESYTLALDLLCTFT